MKNRLFFYLIFLYSLFPFGLHFLSDLPNSILPTLANIIICSFVFLITLLSYKVKKICGVFFMCICYVFFLLLYISGKEYFIFYNTYPIHESFLLIKEATNASNNFSIEKSFIAYSIIILTIIFSSFCVYNKNITYKKIFCNFMFIIIFSFIYNILFDKQNYTNEAIENTPSLLALVETPISALIKSLLLFNDENKESIENNHLAKDILSGKSIFFPERAMIDDTNKIFVTDKNLGIKIKYSNSDVMDNNYHNKSQFKNVILIILESIRSEEIINSDIAPNINEFLNNSVTYTNFYSTNITTVKSEHAILCGLPEISNQAPYSTIHGAFNGLCLPESLRKNDLDTYWFHGNTNEFFNRKVFHSSIGFNHVNGKEYFISNGYDIKNDIGWGIPDEYIFKKSLAILEKSKRNFFAEILTLTNHQPFSWKYPNTPPDKIKYSGIDKYKNYLKGINYTDYAFGTFMAEFKKSSLYNNTILIVTGDHGVPFYKRDYSNNEKTEILYRVPLAIYHKGIISKKVITGEYSHLDLAPTIIDLLNFENNMNTPGLSLYGKHASKSARPIYLMNMKNYSFKFGEFSCFQYDGSCQNIAENEQWKTDAKKAFNYMEIMQIAGYRGNI